MEESYKDRMLKEHSELKERYIKLIEFMTTGKYYMLDYDEQRLMTAQKTAMEVYIQALTQRINYNEISSKRVQIPDTALLSTMGAFMTMPFKSNVEENGR